MKVSGPPVPTKLEFWSVQKYRRVKQGWIAEKNDLCASVSTALAYAIESVLGAE